ncbi:MAG: hypothetical protein U0V04_07355 [Spirosomataceae bacterium]
MTARNYYLKLKSSQKKLWMVKVATNEEGVIYEVITPTAQKNTA